MRHYVYLLEFQDGMKYVGARSCNFDPKLDTCYLGSGRHLPKDRNIFNCKKTVLKEYLSREAAITAEITYIKEHACVVSKRYYNTRISTFDRYGTTGKKQNRNKELDQKALKIRAEKFKQYKGKNRTPALLDADIRRGNTIRGTKNPAKGLSGIANNGFTPWYYITPAGDYHEMYSVTRKDFAPTIGLTPRQMEHRFHHSNIHKAGRTKPSKGWIFGTLPRPINTDVI